MSIGLRADPVPSGGPKTAVRVRGLREILNATETYTVQRRPDRPGGSALGVREGFIGSYTITAPSFTVVGEARFYPLTPLAPPKTAWQALEAPAESSAPPSLNDGPVGIDFRGAAENASAGRSEKTAQEDLHRSYTSGQRIAHAYPRYDVKRGRKSSSVDGCDVWCTSYSLSHDQTGEGAIRAQYNQGVRKRKRVEKGGVLGEPG